MPIHFTGLDGYYEIYHASRIIHRRVDSSGKNIYKKEYKNYSMIPHKIDKEKIFKIIYGEKEIKNC
jgi:hypothetical protein